MVKNHVEEEKCHQLLATMSSVQFSCVGQILREWCRNGTEIQSEDPSVIHLGLLWSCPTDKGLPKHAPNKKWQQSLLLPSKMKTWFDWVLINLFFKIYPLEITNYCQPIFNTFLWPVSPSYIRFDYWVHCTTTVITASLLYWKSRDESRHFLRWPSGTWGKRVNSSQKRNKTHTSGSFIFEETILFESSNPVINATFRTIIKCPIRDSEPEPSIRCWLKGTNPVKNGPELRWYLNANEGMRIFLPRLTVIIVMDKRAKAYNLHAHLTLASSSRPTAISG